ncbi:MAG TPA: hypothetical protein VGR06_20385 [Actinophytocola sp.]|jgi:hypothetical protein|uniref:hypothetical protein n=1 Tax=Actinophytocola sp. TaxID=1872138 RepID=UPI002E076AE1|nr:hypothetical protein [Actinophytocola sp.]
MQDQLQRPELKSPVRKAIDFVGTEPVAFQGIIQASLATLVGFGVISMTSEQTGLVMALTAAVLGFVTRRYVTPNSKISDGKS